MGQIVGFARASTLAVAAALAVIAIDAPPISAAEKAKPAAPAAAGDAAAQAQKSVESARRAYDAGVKAYQAGSIQPAVDQLSSALRAGGLPSSDMARALYIRGLAYKKQSKPGLAISDLTSALWLKNGLADADRQIATAERAEAYRMAGLGDGNAGSETVAVADPNKAAPKSVVAAATAAPSKKVVVPAPIPGGTEITRQAPDSQAAIDAANARQNATARADVMTLESAVANSVTGGSASRSVPAAIPAPATAAPAVAAAAAPAAAPGLSAAPVEGAATSSSTGSPSTIAGFFSNLFSGGSAVANPDGGTVTTASTTPATPATSSWSDQTSVASGNSKSAAKTAAAVSTATGTAKPVAAKAGKYKIHIAAVRSRADAEALAQTLATKHGAQLKSGTPLVDEAVIGSMGTFYRVRVGSYVGADEPRGVCNALRTSGFDCLVVTN